MGILNFLYSIGIAILLAILINVFVFQPFNVEGHSMDPTLHDQEHIYVSKIPHTLSKLPSYGDIVIIDSRLHRERLFKDELLDSAIVRLFTRDTNHSYYVKRVIGLSGDVIEVKNGKVYRNGKVLDEPYIMEAMNTTSKKKWTVPENHVFVMGDNRNHSTDSREIGFCPLDHVIGKMVF